MSDVCPYIEYYRSYVIVSVRPMTGKKLSNNLISWENAWWKMNEKTTHNFRFRGTLLVKPNEGNRINLQVIEYLPFDAHIYDFLVVLFAESERRKKDYLSNIPINDEALANGNDLFYGSNVM